MSVWADISFGWNPGDSTRASYDVVSRAEADSGLTEGPIVVTGGRIGRVYSGAVGSRFPIASSFSIVPPADTTVVASIYSGGTGTVAFFGHGGDTDQYAALDTTGANWRSDGAGSRGSNPWPFVPLAPPAGFSVLAARFISTGATTGRLEAFLDDPGTPVGSGNFSSSNSLAVNRITIGRQDDSTPVNSSGVEVYAFALWRRALTDDELAEAMGNPYGYMSVVKNRSLTQRSLDSRML